MAAGAEVESAAEHRLAVFIERKFTRGQEPHFRHLVNTALGVDVETADGFDLVVEH